MHGGPRLQHVVTIERFVTDPTGAVDAYNQPLVSWEPVADVEALIQPKGGRELAAVSQAGPVRGEYRVFMLPTDVTEADHLVRADPAEVYEVHFVGDAGGAGHHLELDCSRVYP